MMEIIEQKNTELKICEHAEMLSLLIDIAQDAIYTVDRNGIITSVNQSMIDITGFSREEYIGKSFTEFMHPDELSYALEIHNMIQNNIKPPIFELRYLHKSGVYNEAEFSASPIIKDGVSIGTLGVGRDISKRKLTQKKLFESEQKFRFIVENASEVIFNLTVDGKFEFITKNIKEFSGYSPEEVYNTYFYNYVHPDDLKMVLENFKKTLQRVIEPIEFRIITKDKKILYVKGSSNIKEENDEILSVYGILTDVTRMKLAEEKLKEIIEEKNILLKEVHHRVKNNLQVIISLLKLKTFSLNNKEVTAIFNSFVERLNSMKLVHEQLYHSDNIKYINFKKYIKELINHIETSYHCNQEDNIIINYNIHNDDLSIETLIPISLIINELLTNSFKYAFPYKTGVINIAFLKNENNEFSLIIGDNGIGFDKEIMYNGGDTLGLKLVNTLVNQIDGKLTLSTENGAQYEIQFFDKSESLQ